MLPDRNECHAKQASTLQSDLMLRFRGVDVRDGQFRVATDGSRMGPSLLSDPQVQLGDI